MRFANFISSKIKQQQPHPPRGSAVERMRRLVAGELASKHADRQAATMAQREIPVDLDQRVRLVGEW